MHTHPNARLTPLSRERLLRRLIDHGEGLAFLADKSGISVRSAYNWLAHYRSGCAAALVDRRSVRRWERRTLDPLQLQHAVDLRHERCTHRRVARVLAVPLSTLGLGRLKNLHPAEPVRRYQWTQPGDMIHVDTKQLTRFDRVIPESPEIAGLVAPVVPVTRKLIWPSTTPNGLPTWRCCRMRRTQPRWDFCCGPLPGSMARESAARGLSPITALPTAPNHGEKPVQRSVSHQNARGRTPQEPTASRALHQDPADGVSVLVGLSDLS